MAHLHNQHVAALHRHRRALRCLGEQRRRLPLHILVRPLGRHRVRRDHPRAVETVVAAVGAAVLPRHAGHRQPRAGRLAGRTTQPHEHGQAGSGRWRRVGRPRRAWQQRPHHEALEDRRAAGAHAAEADEQRRPPAVERRAQHVAHPVELLERAAQLLDPTQARPNCAAASRGRSGGGAGVGAFELRLLGELGVRVLRGLGGEQVLEEGLQLGARRLGLAELGRHRHVVQRRRHQDGRRRRGGRRRVVPMLLLVRAPTVGRVPRDPALDGAAAVDDAVGC